MRTPDGDRRTQVGRPDDAPTRAEAERDEQGRRPTVQSERLAHYYEQSRRTDPWNPENWS